MTWTSSLRVRRASSVVFFLPELRKTYAQLTPEEKAAVSHRGKALAVFDGRPASSSSGPP